MKKPIKYQIKADPSWGSQSQAGDIVYEATSFDYGNANDMSRATGVLHTSVTLEEDGSGPYFPVPTHLLEEFHAQS